MLCNPAETFKFRITIKSCQKNKVSYLKNLLWCSSKACVGCDLGSASTGTFAILMAGGVAGVVTWCFATPMDVVKSRLQMSGAGGREYSGILHCIRLSVREEGLRVFFKGLLLNSVRAFPVNAVTFLSYESLMKLFFSMSR